MPLPEPWSAQSFNQVPDSDNRIHSDAVARAHGFEGALVPGVTVSAYLLHPAVVAWGGAFVARGHARAVVQRPLYDRRPFSVDLSEVSSDAYRGTLVDSEGTVLATAVVERESEVPPLPRFRGDAPATGDRVPPTRQGLEQLRQLGMGAVPMTWDRDHVMASYLREPGDMPPLLSPSGEGFANPAFVLGATNWLLAANVALGPWLHLQTTSWHFAAIPSGSNLISEGRITDLFEKKGHEFVDIDAGLFFEDGQPAARIELRAIYRLRS